MLHSHTPFARLRTRVIGWAILGVSLLCGGVLRSHPLQDAPEPGYTYTCEVTFSGEEEGKPVTQPPLIAKVETAGAKSRVEIVAGSDPKSQTGEAFVNGDYLLTEDGGKTLVVVHAAKNTYRKMDVHKLAGLGLDMEGAEVSVKTLRQNTDTVPTSDTVGGKTARRGRVFRNYELGLRAGGFEHTITIADAAEYWCVAEGVPATNPVARFLDASANTLIVSTDATKLPEVESADAKRPAGFPLKAVWTKQIETDFQEGKSRSVITMEVKNLTAATLTPDRFRVPAGVKPAK